MMNGIFLPSDDLDSSVMISYLQALLSACPLVKYTSVKADEKLKGFKVKFSEPEEDSVWKERQITLDNQQVVSIYPLTTTLWINGKNKKDDDSFKEDLTESINLKLSIRILDFQRLEKIDDFEKWILKIDAPELDASSIREIDSTLASSLSYRELTVRIWCRNCKEYGHFFRECGRSATSDTEAENQRSSGDSKAATTNKNEVSHDQNESDTKSSPIKNGRYSEITDNCLEFDSHFDDLAAEIGEELLKERQEQDSSKTSKNKSTPKKNRTMDEFLLKKEIEEEEQNPQNIKKHKSTRYSRESDKDPAVKEELDDGASTSHMIHSENSRDDDDDDVVVLEDETSPYHDASRDSNFSKPDDTMLSEPSSSSRHDESSSLTSPPRRVQKRAKPTSRVEDFSNLSNQLQNCIRHVCNTIKVLEWEKLKAFVTHVKKKSNPLRIALNFTKDTDGLKKQLQGILDRYYSTPQTGTKEDIQFIKWLSGLVDRFDGTIPRKRKPANKNGDGPPNKK